MFKNATIHEVLKALEKIADEDMSDAETVTPHFKLVVKLSENGDNLNVADQMKLNCARDALLGIIEKAPGKPEYWVEKE